MNFNSVFFLTVFFFYKRLYQYFMIIIWSLAPPPWSVFHKTVDRAKKDSRYSYFERVAFSNHHTLQGREFICFYRSQFLPSSLAYNFD